MADLWRFIESDAAGAFSNMALDEAIAGAVRRGESPPTLRVYRWLVPSVSIGRFQKAGDVNLEFCCRQSIPLVRRPTGGRAVLHGDEFTYSFSAPARCREFAGGLFESYRKIASAFELAFRHLGLSVELHEGKRGFPHRGRSSSCFSSASFGEMSLNGAKVIGSAQRRWPDGILQQGSIPLRVDFYEMSDIMKISRHAQNNHHAGLRDLLPDLDASGLGAAVRDGFEKTFDVCFSRSVPSREELNVARNLAEIKYSNPAWNLRR